MQQSNEIKFAVRPLPGGDVIKGFAETAAQAAPESMCQLTVETNFANPHLQTGNLKTPELLKEGAVLDLIRHLQSHLHIVCRAVHLTLPQVSKCAIVYETKDALVAHIMLRNMQNVPEQQCVKLVDGLAERFALSTEAQVVAASLPPVVQESLRYREEAVAALHAEVSRLAGLGAEQMQRNDEFIRSRVDELDKRYDEKGAKLEEDYRGKKEQLDRREEEHRVKVAQFEVRESKYVRRDLLKRMREEIEAQKTITLSKATGRKRWVMHVVCVGSMVAGLGLVVQFGIKLFLSETTDWRYVAPITTGMLLFSSTLIYYIRWINAWFKEHAQAEFRNMRFSADILRASWLAELGFEWHKEKGEVLPESLIANFSRNMFIDERFPDTEHPVDVFAAALKGISKFTVGKDGVNVEMKEGKQK